MDENRIYEFFDHDDNLVKFVTHADYRALEEELKWARSQLKKADEELESIKERVESMQDRIDAYQEKGLIQ